MVTMIALGIQNHGAAVKPVVEANFVTGIMSACNIAFSYGEHDWKKGNQNTA